MLKFKELDDKKKRFIIIVSVLVVFIGVTLAYVVGQISDGAIGNANVTADTTDNLQFSVDKDISLNPTQFNVTEGGGGLSDTAVGTATLLANSTNETATYDYYVYFNIKSNDYTYTTEDYKPEIVLTITDPEGNPVTKLANNNLEYVEAENADGTITKGFDITTASGLINIASNYEITSSSSTNATEQDWTFTVTFINLTTNQTENGGRTLNAEIILSKDVTNYHEICEPGTMACDIARLYNEENPESNGLYYHNGTMIDENEYCMYDGNYVVSFITNNASTSTEDCNTVYSLAGMYYDASVITGGLEEGAVEEVTWDSVNSVCETTSGIPVYNDSETAVSQESCSGYAAIMGDSSVIMINVGSGTMEKIAYCMYEGNQVLSLPDGTPSTSAEDCNTVYSVAGIYYDASVITGGLEEGVVEEVTWDGATCKTTTSGATVYTDIDNNTPVSQESCNGYAAIMEDSSVIMVNVGSGTIETAVLDAEDYSYRYAGANPNNYVCFGSDEGSCTNDNLYRIIGVFDGKVKLIKADYTTSGMLGTNGRDYYGTYDFDDASYYKGSMDTSTIAGYRWNYDTSVSSGGSNNWTTSEFNTINLNTNYWNYLDTTWQDLIATTIWHLGGMTSSSNTAKAFYDGERNNVGYGSNPTTYSDEIGLMYPSDYGYAASPDSWVTDLYDYDNSTITANNWLYMGLYEWTITPDSSGSGSVFSVNNYGYLSFNNASIGYAARPVFYLESNVELSGGTGTSSDPYRLAV